MTISHFVSLAATLVISACSHDAARAPAPTGTAPSAEGSAMTCPAPKQTTDACAAVEVYAKNPASGECCRYAGPCYVPFEGPQFSDAACTTK